MSVMSGRHNLLQSPSPRSAEHNDCYDMFLAAFRNYTGHEFWKRERNEKCINPFFKKKLISARSYAEKYMRVHVNSYSLKPHVLLS